MVTKLPTIAMTPAPDLDYNPMPLILSGQKTHTLRKHRCRGRKEITVGGKRTGIVVKFTKHDRLRRKQWETDEFAEADGFAEPGAGKKLARFLSRYYTIPPSRLWCNHFRIEGAGDGGAADS